MRLMRRSRPLFGRLNLFPFLAAGLSVEGSGWGVHPAPVESHAFDESSNSGGCCCCRNPASVRLGDKATFLANSIQMISAHLLMPQNNPRSLVKPTCKWGERYCYGTAVLSWCSSVKSFYGNYIPSIPYCRLQFCADLQCWRGGCYAGLWIDQARVSLGSAQSRASCQARPCWSSIVILYWTDRSSADVAPWLYSLSRKRESQGSNPSSASEIHSWSLSPEIWGWTPDEVFIFQNLLISP